MVYFLVLFLGKRHYISLLERHPFPKLYYNIIAFLAVSEYINITQQSTTESKLMPSNMTSKIWSFSVRFSLILRKEVVVQKMTSLPYLVPNYRKNWHMCCQCLVLSFDIRFVAIENFVFTNWVQMGNSIFRFPGGEKCFHTKNIPRIYTVDPEIFARLYFREIRVSDLFASWNFRERTMPPLFFLSSYILLYV